MGPHPCQFEEFDWFTSYSVLYGEMQVLYCDWSE